jgi:hypothetical protein
MEIPFVIYIRAVGLYAMLTFPVIISPLMYFISLFYVVMHGWFAWAIFTAFYLIIAKVPTSSIVRLLLLALAVPVAVAFAFQMIEVLKSERNVWRSGIFLLFPFAATICGWISLFISAKKIIKQPEQLQPAYNKKYEN